MKEKNETPEKQSDVTDSDRREALKKLGKSAYAAPVILSLLASKKASAFTPPPPP